MSMVSKVPPNAIPLFEFILNDPSNESLPPFRFRIPAVAEAGTAPKFLSFEIESTPLVKVVLPE